MPTGIYIRTKKHKKGWFKKGHISWNKGKHIYLGGGFKKGTRSKKKHWNWQGGLPKCLECRKQLKSYKAKRCKICADKNSKGKISYIMTKKIKRRISQSLMGCIPWNKGKSMRHSSSFQFGKNHPNWKGGRNRNKHSLSNKKYKQWRNIIFKRDNYICQKCRKQGGRLEAHHIKSWVKYPKLRFIVNNGLTLCKKCHRGKNIKRNQKF